MELDLVKLKEFKPVLAGYVREAQTLVSMLIGPDEKVVHDVRVLMKKSRAVLKLAGSQLDKGSIDRDLFTFREVGRKMCNWRETSVLRKTLKELRKENPDIFSRLSAYEKVTTLMKKAEPILDPCEEVSEKLEELEVILKKARYRIRFQTMNKLDPRILLRELERTYKIVVDSYIRCMNNRKQKNLHEFRKKSKDFLYQLYFFRPLNGQVVKALEKKLDAMTQNLGKYNDLAQLIRALDYKYDHESDIPALDELIIKIREKQDSYLEKVWPTAYKVFCPGQNLVNVLGFKLLVI
jgi:CHAD domain-containing protein